MKLSTIHLRLIVFVVSILFGAISASASVTCTVSTSGVSFGNYDSTAAANKDSIGYVDVSCSGAPGDVVNYSISLSLSGTPSNRKLSAGASTLTYNIYTDSTRTLAWGDGTNGTTLITDNYTMVGSSTTRTYTVYGRIFGAQNQATIGSYSEASVVTLTY
jgi:spore coat protein U-like protein